MTKFETWVYARFPDTFSRYKRGDREAEGRVINLKEAWDAALRFEDTTKVVFYDHWDCKHMLTLEAATKELKAFYDAWPHGLAEIESAIRTKDSQIEQLTQIVNFYSKAVNGACDVIEAMQAKQNKLEKQLASKQAIIDSLMFEFCPNEMTEEQIAEWSRHQKPAPAEYQFIEVHEDNK